jgi:hypothetical protein
MKANLLATATLVIASLALGACAEQRMIPAPTTTPRPAPSATPRPTAVPPPPAAATWADLPATPGDWRWSMEGGQSVARFAGGRLTMRCDPATRSVLIERAEAGAALSGTTLTIRTQTLTRAFAGARQAGSLSVSLPSRDPLLDAMAFSRGRFAVEAPGVPALLIPSWTEVSRVIEDCR